MLETVARQTPEEMAVQVLDFSLPTPDDPEFEQRMESAWQVCDRMDLQTEIWRGRLLRTARDREMALEKGGSFEKWLATKEITRSRAYRLIELAECADRFLAAHPLADSEFGHFSKAAFMSTAKADPPIQSLIVEQARRGEKVTQRQVEDYQREWVLANEQVLPESIRERLAESSLPSRPAAKAAIALAQLPAAEREIFCEALNHSPDLSTLRQVSLDAQAINRSLSDLWRVQVITEETLTREALGEAARQGMLAQTIEMLRWAARVERSLSQLYTAWQRFGALHEQMEKATDTQALHRLLTALEPLTDATPTLDIGSVRLSAQISAQDRWIDVAP
jgi:hypothetical protein